jgi:hypothetical protein
MLVNFDKDKYLVVDKTENYVIIGNRTSDNCYEICTSNSYNCMLTIVDEVKLWRQKFGHINYK